MAADRQPTEHRSFADVLEKDCEATYGQRSEFIDKDVDLSAVWWLLTTKRHSPDRSCVARKCTALQHTSAVNTLVTYLYVFKDKNEYGVRDNIRNDYYCKPKENRKRHFVCTIAIVWCVTVFLCHFISRCCFHTIRVRCHRFFAEMDVSAVNVAVAAAADAAAAACYMPFVQIDLRASPSTIVSYTSNSNEDNWTNCEHI